MRNKIKLITVSSLAVFVLLGSINMVLAEDAGPLNPKDQTPTAACKTNSTELRCVNLRAQELKKTVTAAKKVADEAKIKLRKTRAEAIKKVVKNQSDRGQNVIDQLQKIIDRIKAVRAKLTGTDLTVLDALIKKAEIQKQEAATALVDVKAKAAALSSAATTSSTDVNKSAPSQQVKDLRASLKVFKQKLTALRTTLRQIIKLIKARKPATSDKPKTTNSSSTTNTTAGSTENK